MSDLALNVTNAQNLDWRCFRGGLLKSALAEASGLEHFSLVTNASTKNANRDFDFGHWPSRFTDEDCTPLLEMFPIVDWKSLRNFSISHLLIHIDDFISFLAKLPPTIQSLTFIGRSL
jgi:hypothetical protein